MGRSRYEGTTNRFLELLGAFWVNFSDQRPSRPRDQFLILRDLLLMNQAAEYPLGLACLEILYTGELALALNPGVGT